jgi:hypothetical protein
MFIGKHRLRLSNYFDSLINEIDLFTEKKLQVIYSDEAKSIKLNQDREAMMKQIKQTATNKPETFR